MEELDSGDRCRGVVGVVGVVGVLDPRLQANCLWQQQSLGRQAQEEEEMQTIKLIV